jgi:hypothetical protein
VNNRSHEVDTLFRRMAVATTAARDPAIEDDAARAVEDWPLLTMLTHARTAPVKPVHHMMMPVEEPMTLSAPVAEAAPILEPEPSPGFEPETPSRTLSPLEHLFRRAEQTGKPQTLQTSVFASAPPPAPPLKAPSQRRLAPLPPLTQAPVAAPPAAPKVAARAVEDAVTIEPQPRQWRALDSAPERLFERAGAR